jgi:hypothetical protein
MLVRGLDDAGITRSFGVWPASPPGWTTRGGRIGQAYWLSEWLDCECHVGSSERAAADAFQAELRALPRCAWIPRAPHSAGVTTGAIGRSLTEPVRSGSVCGR